MSGKDLGQALGILVAIALIVTFASVVSNSFKKPPVIEEIIGASIKCPAEVDAFSNTSKKVTLLEDKKSNGTKGVLKGYRVNLEREGLTSDVACGYLLYQVSFAGNPIEQKYMVLVMKPTGSKLGGHIFPDEKKGAIIDVLDDRTQVLMPLDVITYDGLSKTPIKEANWAALLNVSNQMEFEVGLSADTPDGKINLLQIAYKCINKETGKETDTCNLKVGSVTPF